MSTTSAPTEHDPDGPDGEHDGGQLDRVLCACHEMHFYCSCGARLDACELDDEVPPPVAPSAATELARWLVSLDDAPGTPGEGERASVTLGGVVERARAALAADGASAGAATLPATPAPGGRRERTGP